MGHVGWQVFLWDFGSLALVACLCYESETKYAGLGLDFPWGNFREERGQY